MALATLAAYVRGAVTLPIASTTICTRADRGSERRGGAIGDGQARGSPTPAALARSGGRQRRSLRCLGRGRQVLVVVLLLVVRAVVSVAKLNRPDITGPEAEPPQLICYGAHGLVPGIPRRT